jgi:hypothetical protein
MTRSLTGSLVLTFPEFWRRWPDWPGHGRLLAFDSLSEHEQQKGWEDLAERCRPRIDGEYLYEQRLREEWPPPKRHQLARRTTAATSTKPGTVGVSTAGTDPLKTVDLRMYFAAHGIEVPPSGKVRCIAPGHEDVHPSCSVTSSHWRCWSCGERGDIIDAASLFHGMPASGAGYWKLRDLILERLVWAPIRPERDR